MLKSFNSAVNNNAPYRKLKTGKSGNDLVKQKSCCLCNTELLTRKQVMELLSIGGATLNRWCKQGILIRYGMGRRVYFKKEELLSKLIMIDKLDK